MLGLFCLGLTASTALLLEFDATSLAILCVGYLAVAMLDPIAARDGEAPAFFGRLRPPQMTVALVGLLGLFAYRLTT